MRVKVHATLRAIVGDRWVELPLEPGATVHDVARCLAERWPKMRELLFEDGELSRRVHVFVDGRSARHLPDRAHTVLREGQEIDVAPAVAGG